MKPVIDLDDCKPVDACQIPDRLTEQVVLRDPTCACNLAPLC